VQETLLDLDPLDHRRSLSLTFDRSPAASPESVPAFSAKRVRRARAARVRQPQSGRPRAGGDPGSQEHAGYPLSRV
jgi:hypothetical protein